MKSVSYAKSENTIANILTAAESLFLNKNYADVTVTEIAAEADVTKGALYHHFPSKEAVYLTMIHTDLEEKRHMLHEAVEMEGDCRSRLRRLTEIFLELPEGKRDLIKLVRRDINIFKYPARNRLIRAYQAALPEQIESILIDGLENGELVPADSRVLSWLYVGMVEVTLTAYAQKILGGNQMLLDYVLNFFFNGASQVALQRSERKSYTFEKE
jgi:AcrR family transcriptional regulator